MSATRTIAAGLGVLLVIVYAVGSGLTIETSGTWYDSLQRPSWQPPDIVFGLIWPYNFLVLGIALVAVALQRPAGEVLVALSSALLSIVAALVWSWLFYRPHLLTASAWALLAAALFTVPVVVVTWRSSALLGVLLLPYQAWLAVATSLAWGYAHLNR